MSDAAKTDKAPAAAPAAPAKASKVGAILAIVLPAIFSGGAAFGGAKAAGGGGHKTVVVEVPANKPPGPTLALEPFLVTVNDSNGKTHAMKVVLAVEFNSTVKEETLKTMTPRVRDGSLGYLRSLAFDMATDRTKLDQLRTELLEAVKKAGSPGAERVLITDFVVQ